MSSDFQVLFWPSTKHRRGRARWRQPLGLAGLIGGLWILGAAGFVAASDAGGGRLPPVASRAELPPLPEGLASFGAAVVDRQLYVYGGHVGRTHEHSIANLSAHFRVLDLDLPAAGWRDLGPVTAVQGLALVAHGRSVCRIGGLDARNAAGDEEDLHSTADVACFDVDRQRWRALPPLPTPRSSHDAVMVGDQLVVVGGWQLRGADLSPVWADTLAVLDLSQSQPVWRDMPQPFRRRALAVASDGRQVVVIGGLGENGTSQRVDLFDLATETWMRGPDWPALTGRLKGFGVSATRVDGQILASGADGLIYAFDTTPEGLTWRPVGRLTTPRFFHRLVGDQGQLVAIGGADADGHLAALEAVDPASLTLPVVDETSVVTNTWSGFRGRGDGHASFAAMPLHWSDSTGVAWRIALPGTGQSQPAIHGDLVVVTSIAGDHNETLIASGLDLITGAVRWRRRFAASQRQDSSEMVSHAAPTPVLDAQRAVAFWESGDVIAFDHDGETLWHRSLTEDYGPFLGNHGLASSPIRTTDAVVLQVTHDGPSYFIALDPATGSTRWRTERPKGVSWTTPSVVSGLGGERIVASAAGRVEALDANTGAVLWSLRDVAKNHVPSAVVSGDLLIVASSQVGQCFALHHGGNAPRQEHDIRWRADGVASGFGSPIVHQGCVLFTNKAGGLACVDRGDGSVRWRYRLPSALWASPIATEERLYFFTRQGETVVLRHDAEGVDWLATNALTLESPVHGVAAAPGAFVLRAGSEVLRVGVPDSR